MSVSPSSVKTSGGEEILLSGENFVPSSTMWCHFGDTLQVNPAVFISRAAVSCITPAHKGGYVTVEVTFNGVDYTSNQRTLYYLDFIDVVGISPQTASVSGGVELHVELNPESTYANAKFECLFARNSGTLTRPAYIVTATELKCFTPRWTPGNVAVGILVDGKRSFMSGVPLALVPTPFISSIKPDHGPSSGGTVLTVLGDDLDTDSIACVFENTSVLPTIATEGEITCIVPPKASGRKSASNEDGKVVVRVAVDGNVASNGVEYIYDTPLEIHGITMTRLPEDGGASLTVEGSNFLNSTDLVCQIGSRSSLFRARYIDSTRVTCTVPEAPLSQVTIGVSNNGQDFVFSEHPLTYDRNVYIAAIAPIKGSLNGGTPVQLSLINADVLNGEKVAMFCSFGGSETRALLLQNDTATCISPGVMEPSTVPVSFFWRTLDQGDRFAGQQLYAVEFHYTVAPELTQVSPSSGNAAEGTVVTLSGSGFTEGMIVRFDVGRKAEFVPATFGSETIIMAQVPPTLAEGVLSIAVSANRVDYSGSRTFYCRPRSVLYSVYPSQITVGSDSSNTTLVLRGKGFSETAKETMRCRIGDEAPSKPVQWISSTQILCPAPTLEVGLYSVRVALNGINFVDDGIKVWYREQLVIYRIAPAFGSVQGNTQVRVFGSNFLAATNETDMACFFDRESSPLRVLNASHAECISPSGLQPGDVAFSVAHLGLSGPSANKAEGPTFRYHKTPIIAKISPPFIGATDATSIHVVGANFMDSPLLSCLIGGVPVRAAFVSTSVIDCVVDEVPDSTWQPGDMLTIDVANNAQDFSNSEMQILVQSPIHLRQVVPSKGAIHQSIAVKIKGEHFSALQQQLYCQAGETQTVRATNLGDGWIECLLPASSRPGSKQISVTADGVHFTSESLLFTYEDAPVVRSIYPVTGPFGGGTVIDIHGEGFDPSELLHCVFGSSVAVAQIHTSLLAECISPPYASGSDPVVTVSVAKFATPTVADFLMAQESEVTFFYTKRPEVVAISPSVGPEGAQTLVRMETTGTQFFENAWCRFANLTVKAERDLIDAEISDMSGVLYCRTPVLPTGRFFLEVSINERDFSDSRVPFTVEKRAFMTALTPRYGPPAGGNVVTVSGSDFSNDAQLECSFDGVRTLASLRSPQQVQCPAPLRKTRNETHRVAIRSRAPQNEIQLVAIDVASEGSEVQVVTTKGWGTAPEVQELRLVHPAASTQAQVTITTSSAYQPEVQRLVLQNSPQVPEVQSITTTAGSAISGTFSLRAFGFSTGLIAFNAAPATLQQALKDATLGSHDFTVTRAGPASTALSDYTWFVTFISDVGRQPLLSLNVNNLLGSAATVSVARIRSGTVYEVQTLGLFGQALPSAIGSFIVSYEGEEMSVDIHANAAVMATALNQLAALKQVSVTYSSTTLGADTIYEWNVQFDTKVQPISLLEIRVDLVGIEGYVVTKSKGTAPVPSGSFSLTLGTEITPSLAWDVAAEDLKSALETLSSVVVAIVNLDGGTSQARRWGVTFPPINGDLPLMIANYGSPTFSGVNGDLRSTLSTGLGIVVTTLSDGKPLQGAFKVTSQATGLLTSISTSADCPTMLSTVGGQACSLIGVGLSGERKWVVDFAAGASLSYPIVASNAGMTGTSAGVTAVTTAIGNKPEIQQLLFSFNNALEIQRISISERGSMWEIQSLSVFSSTAVHGVFQIGFGSNVTPSLSSQASAAQVLQAVQSVYNSGDVSVARTSIVQTPLSGYRWDIIFYTVGDIPALRIQSNLTNGAGTVPVTVTETRKGVVCEIQNVTLASSPGGLAGSFKLAYQGSTTSSLPFAADADALQAALEQLPTIDAVNVTLISPNTEGGRTWMVAFPFQAGDLPSLQITGILTTVGISPTIGVSEVQKGRMRPLTGSFSIGYQGSQTQVAVGSSAAQIKSALLALSPLTSQTIQVALAQSDFTGGFSWDVTFVSSVPTDLITMGVTQTAGEQPYGFVQRLQTGTQPAVQQIQTLSSAGGTISGTFFLSYGDDTTSALASSCSAAAMEAALNQLPSIGAVKVSQTAGTLSSTYIWLVTLLMSSATIKKRENGEIWMIYVNGSAPITGEFSLSMDGITWLSIAWDASAAKMEALLESAGFYETVNVERKRLEHTRYPYGDGYGWIVEFLSDAAQGGFDYVPAPPQP
ncbi:hypothetical protein BBJ28_00004863 [Nothophytophthora sp. Chile5]|nr:hypothetical protein BBJ28_00004863 [Nothophytophthora sp. Chile5]